MSGDYWWQQRVAAERYRQEMEEHEKPPVKKYQFPEDFKLPEAIEKIEAAPKDAYVKYGKKPYRVYELAHGGGEKRPPDNLLFGADDLNTCKEWAEEHEKAKSDALSWRTVNDGTKPGNTQVYNLMYAPDKLTWTGISIHGPHVDKP